VAIKSFDKHEFTAFAKRKEISEEISPKKADNGTEGIKGTEEEPNAKYPKRQK